MINLFKLELIDLVKNKRFIIILLLTFFLSLGLSISDILKIEIPNDDFSGYLTGIDSIDALKNNDNQKDYITEDILVQQQEEYKNIVKNYNESQPEYYLQLSKIKYYNLLSPSFKNSVSDGNFSYRKDFENLTGDEVHNYFKNRENNQKLLFNQRTNDENSTRFLMELDNEVEKPFYATNFIDNYWENEILENFNILFFILAILIVVLVSPIFSTIVENGEIQIIKSTKLGYKSTGTIKLILGLFSGLFIYILSISLYLIPKLIIYGFNRLNTSIQVSIDPFLPYNLNTGQIFAIIILIGLFYILNIIAFSLFISTKSKSSLISLSIPILFILGIFLIIIVSKNRFPIVQSILRLLPGSGIKIVEDYTYNFMTFNILGYFLTYPTFIFIGKGIISIGFFISSKISYKNIIK